MKAFLATGVGAATGGAAYGHLYERRALGLTRTTVPVVGWPPGLAGLKIGLLTDVHRSQWVAAEDVTEAARLLMSAEPDLIVLGGDYVTWGDRQFVESSAEALSGLSAPHGVFGILGNHDDDHDMPAALSKRGVEMLRDSRTRLTIGHQALELAGIRFWTKRATEIGALVRNATAPVVLLAHDPRRLDEAEGLNIPLVLSGHTHGGQVVLPGVGALAARKFPVVAGTARRGSTTIFVSRGVGTVYVPLRINCPPEVALLTIQPEAA